MRKECRNEIRAEIIWENRNWKKISLSQHRTVALLQNFHVKSFLKSDIFLQKILIFSVLSEICNCSASTLLQHLPGKILQCHCSRICSALLHCFLYCCMPGTSFPLGLLGYVFLWLLTCEATAQLCPEIPTVGLADTAVMRTCLTKSLGSLLNVPYLIHFSF